MASTKNTKGMDLSTVGELADTATIYLYHPATAEPLEDDEGNPFWVEVYGQDSEHYKQVDNQITNLNIQRQSRGGRGGGANMTAEQIKAQSFQRVYKNVKSWYIMVGGEVPSCTEANAKQILTNYPWIHDQVDEGIHNRKNFLKNSSAN